MEDSTPSSNIELSKEAQANIDACKDEWGSRDPWEGHLNYGYRWLGGGPKSRNEVQRVVKCYVLPFLRTRENFGGKSMKGLPAQDELSIVEIAPGGGRFSAELVRFADSLTLVDVNTSCIEICKERFKYYDYVDYYTNDGSSLSMLKDNSADLIISWDSFVHVDKEVIRKYVSQFPAKLKDHGIAWIHHSALGETPKDDSWRSNMTKELMVQYCEEFGLVLNAQIGLHLAPGKPPRWQDCISIMEKIP